MRISRVSNIRGHRVFRDFSWPADLHAFGRFNLIYGWNGCGKTTLSSLLAHIEKRSNITEGEIAFEIDGKTKVSGAELANASLPPLRVFNRDFINATIQAANTAVEPIYYLGEDSVEKQKQIEELRNALAEAQAKIATAREEKKVAEGALDGFCVSSAKLIKEVLSSSPPSRYNTYDKRDFKQSVQTLSRGDSKAAFLSDEEKERVHKKKDAQLKSTVEEFSLSLLDFEKLRTAVEDLLSRTIVSETLDELSGKPQVGSWVQRGLALHSGEHDNDVCRFCDQLLPSERRAALEAHFNDAFEAFQAAIAGILSTVEQHKTHFSSVRFPDVSRFYDHLTDELAAVNSDAEDLAQRGATFLGLLEDSLRQKKDAPFQTVTLAQSVDAAGTPSVDALENAIAAVNSVIGTHNQITADFQSKVKQAREKLERCYVAEARPEYVRLVHVVEAAESAEKGISDTPGKLQAQIDQIEREITQHQRPADELNAELRAYLGRDELRFEVRRTGYSLLRSGQPVENLSEGERTAIAFLYFLKSLQDKSFDLENGVVVIDDPVSSLDANSLFSAFGYMKERTKECGQLFVLTHNFGFFRQVKNWFEFLNRRKKKDRLARFFMLRALVDSGNGRSAELRALDPLLQEYDSEYQYLFKCIWNSSLQEDSGVPLRDHYSMPNVARRLLEAFFAFRYPDLRGQGTLYASLNRASFNNARKTRMLRFLHTYSHAGRIQDMEEEPWGLAETPAVLVDILALIEHEDSSHYHGMLKRIGLEEPTA